MLDGSKDSEPALVGIDLCEVELRALAALAAAKEDQFFNSIMDDFIPLTSNVKAEAYHREVMEGLLGTVTSDAEKKASSLNLLLKTVELLDNNPPPISNAYLGYHALDALKHRIGDKADKPSGAVFANVANVAIHKSSVFPYDIKCSTCRGTGEGEDSTYCRKCGGAGSIRVEGMMSSGRFGEPMMLITSSLPKKFQPSFPTGLVPFPPMSRGLP